MIPILIPDFDLIMLYLFNYNSIDPQIAKLQWRIQILARKV